MSKGSLAHVFIGQSLIASISLAFMIVRGLYSLSYAQAKPSPCHSIGGNRLQGKYLSLAMLCYLLSSSPVGEHHPGYYLGECERELLIAITVHYQCRYHSVPLFTMLVITQYYLTLHSLLYIQPVDVCIITLLEYGNYIEGERIDKCIYTQTKRYLLFPST